MKRRTFLRTGLAGSAGLAFGESLHAGEPAALPRDDGYRGIWY